MRISDWSSDVCSSDLLPPLVGGMERLNWHLADQLSRFAEVRMIGPSGSASLAPSSVQVSESPLRPLPHFLVHAQWNALKEARKWRPDVVLAGRGERKSVVEGKRGSVRVDLGGRQIRKKKKTQR